jgi:ATP-dependent helicase/DNAse subunit B
MGRQIFEGNIDLSPYCISADRTICDNCDFREACRFDATNSDSVRYLKQFKNKTEALCAMRGGEEQ